MLVCCGVLATLTSVPVARSASAASSGGTVVSVSGSTVNITVHVDVLYGPILDFGSAKANILDSFSKAAAYWNQAFAGTPYHDCLTLHLSIDVTFQPYDATVPPGTNPVTLETGSVQGLMNTWTYDWEKSDPTQDSVGPYVSGDAGDWPYWLFQNPRGVAHEIGHLMGLGDDYKQVFGPDGQFQDLESLPGREGTLMDRGDYIDPDLIDRIGNLITQSGQKLPKCKVWTGPIHVDASITSPGGTSSGTADGTVTLVEDDKGNLTGSMKIAASGGCPYPGTKRFDLKLIGKDEQGKLVISGAPGVTAGSVSSGADDGLICGFPDGFLPDGPGEPHSAVVPIVAILVSDTHAQGSGGGTDNESKDQHTAKTFLLRFRYTIDLHTH